MSDHLKFRKQLPPTLQQVITYSGAAGYTVRVRRRRFISHAAPKAKVVFWRVKAELLRLVMLHPGSTITELYGEMRTACSLARLKRVVRKLAVAGDLVCYSNGHDLSEPLIYHINDAPNWA
ncbi:MAG: hypothetical protein HQL68_04590 [Magnetococcales bacterium]|nr:hypothetical protein [Magnetococcales bacterium]